MRAAGAEVVVCGAGIAGLAAAYHLAVRRGVRDVVVVDERPPLSLTSDKSTECYRNWWPGPGDAVVRLMNRSIDLLDGLAAASGNFFAMNRRGYAYLTADPAAAAAMERAAAETSRLGAGPLRIHRGRSDDPDLPEIDAEAAPEAWGDDPGGADLVLDPEMIRRRFPFVAPDVVAMLAVRRAGWLSAQQLGMYLLDRCRERGARLVRDRVEGIEVAGGRVAAVRLAGQGRLPAGRVVLATGPRLGEVAATAGVELPLLHELHAKATLQDRLGVVPRELPLMIWTDPVELAWSDDERRDLEADADLSWLLGRLPGGVHFRPEGREGAALLLLWSYEHAPREPVLPPRFDPIYPELVVRGLTRMVPGFAAYLDDLRDTFVDGGYYTKAPDNRPLIGPLPVEGLYVLGALSGYGIMASQAVAELLAAHLTGAALPPYAAAFSPARFDDPAYLETLATAATTAGQL